MNYIDYQYFPIGTEETAEPSTSELVNSSTCKLVNL